MILCVEVNGLLTRIMVTLNCSSYKAVNFRGQLLRLMTSDLLYQFTLKMHNIILCFIVTIVHPCDFILEFLLWVGHCTEY